MYLNGEQNMLSYVSKQKQREQLKLADKVNKAMLLTFVYHKIDHAVREKC